MLLCADVLYVAEHFYRMKKYWYQSECRIGYYVLCCVMLYQNHMPYNVLFLEYFRRANKTISDCCAQYLFETKKIWLLFAIISCILSAKSWIGTNYKKKTKQTVCVGPVSRSLSLTQQQHSNRYMIEMKRLK